MDKEVINIYKYIVFIDSKRVRSWKRPNVLTFDIGLGTEILSEL